MARTQPLIATNALIGTWTGLRLALAGTLLAVVVLVAVLAAVSLGSGPAVAPATHAGPVNASMFRALESGER